MNTPSQTLSTQDRLTIALVAGEASGDSLGEALMLSLKQRLPHARFVGIGGPKMIAAGLESWFPMEKLAVRGLVEVLKHVPELLSIRRELARRMLAENVSLFIGIDSPDFNLALERKLKNAGKRTIHFVSPSVWAWRRGRLKGIAAAVNRVLTLFPFETKIYEDAGIPVTFVGHPAAARAADDHARAQARATLNIEGDAPVIALLPGSRHSEIAYHAELLWQSAKKIQKSLQNARFYAPMVSDKAKQQFLSLRPNDVPETLITLVDGQAETVLRAADLGLVCSGTATLEAALARCPHIIYYRASALSVWLVRQMIQVPWVGLPNILAQRSIVPELIQNDANVNRLSGEAIELYRDPERRQDMEQQLARLADELKAETGERAAEAAMLEINS
jgi:lipid-A-disaccharide synthase